MTSSGHRFALRFGRRAYNSIALRASRDETRLASLPDSVRLHPAGEEARKKVWRDREGQRADSRSSLA
jgi:hypothetical protein